MAIAAYLDAKDKNEGVELDEKEMREFSESVQVNYKVMSMQRTKKKKEKIFRKKVQKERLPLLIKDWFSFKTT